MGLRLRPDRLQVHDLIDVAPCEDVMVPANALVEPQGKQQGAQVAKSDVRIRPAEQDLPQDLLVLPHTLVPSASKLDAGEDIARAPPKDSSLFAAP
jgi:hypothetical protein